MRPRLPERKEISTYYRDAETGRYLAELAQPGEYSALIRDLIKERHEQHCIPGLRAAVVKLMAEYKTNGLKEAQS